MNELEEATRLLVAYRKRLNRATNRCPHCGMVHKSNWRDFQRAEQISGMIQKLSRWTTEDRGIPLEKA